MGHTWVGWGFRGMVKEEFLDPTKDVPDDPLGQPLYLVLYGCVWAHGAAYYGLIRVVHLHVALGKKYVLGEGDLYQIDISWGGGLHGVLQAVKIQESFFGYFQIHPPVQVKFATHPPVQVKFATHHLLNFAEYVSVVIRMDVDGQGAVQEQFQTWPQTQS